MNIKGRSIAQPQDNKQTCDWLEHGCAEPSTKWGTQHSGCLGMLLWKYSRGLASQLSEMMASERFDTGVVVTSLLPRYINMLPRWLTNEASSARALGARALPTLASAKLSKSPLPQKPRRRYFWACLGILQRYQTFQRHVIKATTVEVLTAQLDI
jgi:hypothetical protein